ncbi:uncharacterized protein BJX67DRAFT_352226 [Aspergillus lucknowensis]|uniref:Zn(2)-C6 fungal-type domain-containing protein n=1 Tax=Aspergillus lucknowensis TaxID=176173 RepID=A0ABR4LT88_9EURO
MPGTGSQKPQSVRLRTACDPCSTAKVRCDKKHPACGRCFQAGLGCSYSQSRKHGRQPWRKRLAHGLQQVDNRPPPAPIKPAPQPLGLPGQTPSIPWIEEQGWGSLLDYDQNEPVPILASFGAGVGADDVNFDGFMNWDTTNLPSLTPALESLQESSSPGPNTSTHDCEARAISILSSLQHGRMRRGLMSCSTDPAHVYADLELTPTFDRVLAVNRAALDGWSKLMRCSCARCPHLIFLYVSILSKMLFWYRVAAMGERHSAESTDSERGSRHHRCRCCCGGADN